VAAKSVVVSKNVLVLVLVTIVVVKVLPSAFR